MGRALLTEDEHGVLRLPGRRPVGEGLPKRSDQISDTVVIDPLRPSHLSAIRRRNASSMPWLEPVRALQKRVRAFECDFSVGSFDAGPEAEADRPVRWARCIVQIRHTVAESLSGRDTTLGDHFALLWFDSCGRICNFPQVVAGDSEHRGLSPVGPVVGED